MAFMVLSILCVLIMLAVLTVVLWQVVPDLPRVTRRDRFLDQLEKEPELQPLSETSIDPTKKITVKYIDTESEEGLELNENNS